MVKHQALHNFLRKKYPKQKDFQIEVDGEKIYFFEPLEKVISIKELQKIMDTAEEVVNKLKGRKV